MHGPTMMHMPHACAETPATTKSWCAIVLTDIGMSINKTSDVLNTTWLQGLAAPPGTYNKK